MKAADRTQRGGAHMCKEGHGIDLEEMDMMLLGQVLSADGPVPQAAAHIGPRLLAKTGRPTLFAHGCVVAIGRRWG